MANSKLQKTKTIKPRGKPSLHQEGERKA
jgi:exonuclease III